MGGEGSWRLRSGLRMRIRSMFVTTPSYERALLSCGDSPITLASVPKSMVGRGNRKTI